MNDNSPITVGEYQEACAVARKKLSSLSTAELTALRVAVLSARLADGPTPTTFTCKPSDKLYKVFGIIARLDKLEVSQAAEGFSGVDRMVRIFDAEEKNNARGAAPKPVIGPSKHGKFYNDNGTVNLAEVLDAEAEAAK
jgi:hypothetical protein